LFLPDPSYGKNYKNLLDKYPLAPFLDNRDSLVKWTNLIHNKINQQLEKRTINLHDFYEAYYIENSKTNEVFNFKKMKSKFLWLVIIFVLLVFIVLFYYR
jgi:hypothetical protein